MVPGNHESPPEGQEQRGLADRRTRPFKRYAVHAAILVCAMLVSAVIVLAFPGGNTGTGATSSLTIPAPISAVTARVASTNSSQPFTGTATTPFTGTSTTPSIGTSTSVSLPATSSSFVPGTLTAAEAKKIGANELGQIPVLMFHLVGAGANYLTPDQLRFDIALLRSHGFYPTTVREMVDGTMQIPAGKSPVVLTFDDSSPGQYRILDDGSIDPDCAVGILQAAVTEGNWAPKATFFPLLEVNPGNVLWGQPRLAQQKLQNLVKWGYEIGSHGLTHIDFSKATASRVEKELADSQAELDALVGSGYHVFSMSPPYGEYPDDASILISGKYQGRSYDYSAVVMAWGDSSPSPFSSKFDVTHIPRITAAAPEAVRKLMKYWNTHRELLYVSDGDPGTVSCPANAPMELGTLRADLGQKTVKY